MKKKFIIFGVYYLLFAALTTLSILRHWNLMVLMILALLVILYVGIDGPENHMANLAVVRRDPMLAEDIPSKRSSRELPPFLSFLFAALPPALYILGDLFLF